MNSGERQELINVIVILAVLACAYLGQSLIKFGLNDVGEFQVHSLKEVVSFAVRCAVNAKILGGTIIVGFGFLGWIALLSRMEISQALPLLAFSYVPWLLIGHFCFGESIGGRRLIGVLLISGGVLLVATSRTSKAESNSGFRQASVED